MISSQQKWNDNYERGNWECLWDISEVAHNSAILGYYLRLCGGGSVCDIGCGEGVLAGMLQGSGCRQHLGLDFSVDAIKTATERFGNSDFVFSHDDFEHSEYPIPNDFDCLVFSEVIFLFQDPFQCFQESLKHVNSGGFIIVSTWLPQAEEYLEERRKIDKFWEDSEDHIQPLDAVVVRHISRDVSWKAAVFQK